MTSPAERSLAANVVSVSNGNFNNFDELDDGLTWAFANFARAGQACDPHACLTE